MLVLNVAPTFFSQIIKNLCKKIFQILGCTRSGRIVTHEFYKTYIKCSSVLVSGRIYRRRIPPSQFLYSCRRAQHTRHFQPIITASSCCQRIFPRLCYIIKQFFCARYKVRQRVSKFVYLIRLCRDNTYNRHFQVPRIG